MAALFIHDWDGYVFEQSVRDFFEGESPYAVAQSAPYYTYLEADDTDPQWYAYPPLPLLAMAATFWPDLVIDLPPTVERILLKMPMILGTLLLAWVARKWGERLDQPEDRLRKIENLLLFNPFLILVGPIWGMTDPALLAFFLLGLLRFEQTRYAESGLWFATSALIKPFPVLIAMPFLSYYLHHRGWRPLWRAASTGVPFALLVSVPFLLLDPASFWRQVIGMHLARQPQGLTIWTLGGLQDLDRELVRNISLVLMGMALLVLSILSPRLRGRTAPLVLLLATSVQLLLWNRVLNEQYLVLVVTPLLMLWTFGDLTGRPAEVSAKWLAWLFTVITAIQGFHFVTFIPPDIAWAVFGKPVDAVAHSVGDTFNWGWNAFLPRNPFSLVVVVALAALAFVSIQRLRRSLEPTSTRRWRLSMPTASAASVTGCLLFLSLSLAPLAGPAAADASERQPFPDRPLIGAFYYLWWNNPAHDPFLEKPYGNWFEATQFPWPAGFYTQTKGIADLHAKQMRSSGIDVAVVSYHTPETQRYEMFQTMAAQNGLLVAPLIELNQIYDVPKHRPLNDTDRPAQYAVYRLDNHTRDAIRDFVLELNPFLHAPGQYKIDGRPVIYFYDAYVSGVGFDPEDRAKMVNVLLRTKTAEELRYIFGDPDLNLTHQELNHYYPQQLKTSYRFPPRDMGAFYNDGDTTELPDCQGQGCVLNRSAVWREAHLQLNKEFWAELRAELEEEVGPVFLVAGHAMNEAAGFEAGIIKSIDTMETFDGGFIYSPSFAWGVSPRNEAYFPYRLIPTYDQNHRLWEDRNLWLTAYSKGTDRWSSYGIAPAYDDTVKRWRSGFRIPAVHDGQQTYEREWQSTFQNPPHFPVIATWNEFFEGSSIEPSREYGDIYLKQTAAYHAQLAARVAPASDVVTVTHERASRLHPMYSEMDNPHWWGLKTISAAGRLFPDRVVALDGLQPRVPNMTRPSLLVLDGGRDLYDRSIFSEAVAAQIQTWVQGGVPTLIIGREVMEPLRDLVPTSCRFNPELPLGRSIFAPDAFEDEQEADDMANAGDIVRSRATVDGTRLELERNGTTFAFGHQCQDAPHIAYIGLKPWGPVNTWETSSVSDPPCLRVVLSAFFPPLAGTPQSECRVAPVEFTSPEGHPSPGERLRTD